MGTSCRNDLYRGSEAELPIEAAKRELEEETGHVAEHWLNWEAFILHQAQPRRKSFCLGQRASW